jgi:formate C-acetyltransferase
VTICITGSEVVAFIGGKETNKAMNYIDSMKPRDVTTKLNHIIQTIGTNYVEEDMLLRRTIFREVFEKYAREPVQIIIARGFAEFLRRKHISLNEYDLLAGHIQSYDYAYTTPLNIPACLLSPRGLTQKVYVYTIHPEIERYIELYGIEKDSEAHKNLVEFEKYWRNKLISRYVTGHTIAGYERVVQLGLAGLIKEAGSYENIQAQSARIALKGASAYILRYADKAEMLPAATTMPGNAGHMKLIAHACRNIATNPPASFFEAVQLIWFIQEMLLCEAWPSSHSLGRLDKLLQPFYDTDIKKGAITYDQAQEYIYALWIKFASWPRTFQNVTLGGATEDSPYLCGEVTKMCLQATKILRYDQPQLSIRVNDAMPDDFFDEIVDTISLGGGFPALFNDEAIIRAKIEAGVTNEVARNYGIIGCVEPGICGKEYANTEALRINYGKIMELFLNQGTNFLTGDVISMNVPDYFESFDQFYRCFVQETDRLLSFALQCTVMLEPVFGAYWPNPFLSTTMEGCVQSGLDATAGGTTYPFSAANAIGIADASNSLIAVKRLVFDEAKYTLEEIRKSLLNNFEDNPRLYRDLLRCPKYGNDLDEVDMITADLTRRFIERVRSYKNHWGRPFRPGLYSVDYHVSMGMQTGALPEGRRAGAALQNGFSPVQGTDTNGPTAVINSVCKSDLSKISNGMVLDLKFAPSFFENVYHRQAFKSLIQTYFKKGGIEVQFNVVDKLALIEAQQHPELFPDLMVRVSGFSSYFTTLPKETQDEIIKRTELSSL